METEKILFKDFLKTLFYILKVSPNDIEEFQNENDLKISSDMIWKTFERNSIPRGNGRTFLKKFIVDTTVSLGKEEEIKNFCQKFTSSAKADLTKLIDNSFKSIILYTEQQRKEKRMDLNIKKVKKHDNVNLQFNHFETLINDKTKRFVGRKFVFSKIEEIVSQKEGSGYIVISGEPGIGKTCIAAQFVKKTGAPHHFNMATSGITSIEKFLYNICTQLIAKYELNYDIRGLSNLTDIELLTRLLADIANNNHSNAPLVIIIDALDEAEDITKLNPKLNRLSLPQTLPENTFIIVTTRPGFQKYFFAENIEEIQLDKFELYNKEDITEFIQDYITRGDIKEEFLINEWQCSANEFIDKIVENSEGNFMYARYVLEDISKKKINNNNLTSIKDLPLGLRNYYYRHWKIMQTVDGFEEAHKPVLFLLSTVKEPIGIEEVSQWSNLSPYQILRVIDHWREFLNFYNNDINQKFRIYHSSFKDFLFETMGGEVQMNYHSMIAEPALNNLFAKYCNS